MIESFISLVSIVMGIIGANSVFYIFKKCSLGFIENTIIGVFGSIFFIKTFGRLGFDPFSIVTNNHVNLGLLTINLIIAYLGGFTFVFSACYLRNIFKNK